MVDSSFQINVHDNTVCDDPDYDGLMAFSMRKALQQTRSGHVEKVNIFVSPRKPDGFVEWQVHCLTRGTTGAKPGDWFVLGIVQRNRGDTIESHS